MIKQKTNCATRECLTNYAAVFPNFRLFVGRDIDVDTGIENRREDVGLLAIGWRKLAEINPRQLIGRHIVDSAIVHAVWISRMK
jgi:hypothetical protein